MKQGTFAYEADWRQYAFPEQKTGFASEAELEEKYTVVNLDDPEPLKAGGMPIVSDGHRAIINTENEHTLIYGATASKKTRTLVLPLMATLAKARESMIVMDIKGELSDGVTFPQVRNLLEENGYQCRYFNLRDMDGDGFNVLLEPYLLYKAGMKDEATVMVNHLIEALASIYHGTIADPFWEKTARQYLAAVIMLMFRMCTEPDKINMLSVASYRKEFTYALCRKNRPSRTAIYGPELCFVRPEANDLPGGAHYRHPCFGYSQQLLYLASVSNEDITMVINSPGGSVTAGLAIYDTMMGIPCDVSTVCLGSAAAMGAFLLAAGTEGKRYALPNSEVMIHQVMGGASGQAVDVQIAAQRIGRMKDSLNKMLASFTGQPLKRIQADTDRDYFMTAREAVDYGMVDHVKTKLLT